MNNPTAQQVFDQVVTHLLTQNQQALSDGMCMYRTPGGLKCAVGCLIPDEAYDAKMEDMQADLVVSDYSSLMHLRSHSVLLRDLQRVHDLLPPPRWPDKLRALAVRHRLKYNGR